MAKEFVVFFEKSKWDNTNYQFINMYKIDNNFIVNEGSDYGKNINTIPSTSVIALSNEEITGIINASQSIKTKLGSNQHVIKPSRPIFGGHKYIGFKIGSDFLAKTIGNKKFSEEEIVATLLYVFKECTSNISINGSHQPFSKPSSIKFDITASKNRINKENPSVKSIITEGSRKIEERKNINSNPVSNNDDKIKPKQSNVPSFSENRVTKDKSEVTQKETANSNNEKYNMNKLTPNKTIEHLKKRIIGQDKAIEDAVSTLFLNQKLIDMGDEDALITSKANVLIDGPTGTGKTMLVKELSKSMSLPMVITSITSFSTTGYKGNDLENILLKLIKEADGDIELAQRGIICLDEFDKLGANNEQDSLAMRKALQEELLTYLSGNKFDVNYNGKTIEFDTSKVTFIALGAFTNLRERKILENEKKHQTSKIGFVDKNEKKEYSRTFEIDTQDYINEGIMRELVGRFTTKTYTMALSIEDYKNIMLNSLTSPLKSLEKIAESYGKKIIYTDEVISYIAELVYKNNTGARGLQNIFNDLSRSLLWTMMKETNEKNIEITTKMIDELNNKKVRSY